MPLLHGEKLIIRSDVSASQYKNRTDITEVSFANTVTSIGKDAFSGCSNLTSVSFSNSIKTIGEGAFSGCGAVTTLTIPSSFKVSTVFSDSYETIQTIIIPEGNGSTSICAFAFEDCKSLTSVTIPNSVTSIGKAAFLHCESLTSVTIPNSVTSIGDYAFLGCYSLTNIEIPNSVTSIGKQAFDYCIALTNIVIPNSVTEIYTSCFKRCTGLKGLTVNCPGDAFTIDENPIEGLDSLTDVYFNNGLPSAGWTFGTSNPVIHVNNKWNGYDVKDAAVDELEKKTIPLPATSGKIGQVLMVTANGYEWKDVPGGYSAAIADKFQLAPGWNLISLPEAELTASCKEELLKAYVFYKYDKSTGSYMFTNTLIPRECYWVYVKEASTIHFTKVE